LHRRWVALVGDLLASPPLIQQVEIVTVK